MKTVRKTFVTLFVTTFSVAFALLLTVLVAAACSEKVTLRFETGDGAYVASVEGPSGGTYQKPRDPEKEGYFFDGWYPNADFTGESVSLPDVLPPSSTTYYAKYVRCPVLTLEAEGGVLAETEHRVRPGTDLLGYLSDYVPQKEGLVFGGWETDGELLPNGAKMTEEDLRLSARYKAEYEVAVFLQSADMPDRFVKSKELSYRGADWLGAEFTANAPALEHFRYDATASTASAPLHEGGNLFELRYTREELDLRFSTLLPGGGTEEGSVRSRYGAHLTLPDPVGPSDYLFFGWSDGGEEFAGGSAIVLEHSLDLTGSWGKLYPNLRGEGALAVEEGEGTLRADYTLGETRIKGQYFSDVNLFVAGEYRGKLGKGGFLPDDSGRYLGTSLAANATGEEYGVLTLDFEGGTASYLTPQSEVRGGYEYDYDEAAQRYTGDYVFSAGGLSFRFRLGENTFLRQGTEKNDYVAYDLGTGAFLPDALSLDGYGGGLWKRGETALTGSYRGGGSGGEWEFFPANGEPFRVLLGERIWSDGEDFACEQGYLYYDPLLDGRYDAPFGTLILDGYGLNAIYRTEDGETHGMFRRTGNIITVEAETPLKFTVTADGFAHTGEENGSYEGENGTLVLDGAGGATLWRGGESLSGVYRKEEGDWRFSGEEEFRFRLSGEQYSVFHESLFGTYGNDWGLALELDGFGNGIYRDMFGGQTQLRVVYADETLLLLRGEEMRTTYRTLSLSIDRAAKRVSENPSMTAGAFPVYFDGQEKGLLALDGKGGAIFVCGGTAYGTYAISGGNDVRCVLGDQAAQFRIEETDGEAYCLQSDAVGEFTDGTRVLVLDGYGQARYRDENEEFTAAYRMRGTSAEIVRGREVWRFTLRGETFAFTRYTRYSAPDGKSELLLQIGGKGAIFRDGTEHAGMYSEEQLFLSEEREFAYRLYGGEYRVYDRSRAVTYLIEGGETLAPDGCGFGVYTAGDAVYTGTVAVTDAGLVIFASEELPALSGMVGFRQGTDGVLQKLGEEFGLYACAEGGALFLQGDGTAYCRENGVWRAGSCQSVADKEYLFELPGESFRFRVEKKAGKGVYRVYRASLASVAGEYETSEGTLFVDGYQVALGEREFRFVCGGTRGLVVCEEGTQNYFSIRFGGGATLRSAQFRYQA